jgi:glycosyltransferase involved in cell wall biosynthesis
MIVEPRRVLMIAAAFPPAGGSGVQRTLKFTKYLSRFGWQPIVWTVDHIAALPTDESLCREIPDDVEIHRQPHRFGKGPTGRLTDALQQTGPLGSRLANAAKWRIEKWNRKRAWPDEFAKWVDESVTPLQTLVRERNVEAIYSTYSPSANHLLALKLKQATGLPWIADFRDLWTDDLRYRETDPKRHAANVQLEQSVLETADAIVGVSPSQTEVLAGHVPGERAKFTTITNGYDPADFEGVRPYERKPGRPFTLSFVGRFDRQRADDDLFIALRQFVDGLGNERDRFVFRIVGEFDASTRRKLQDAAIPFETTGYVSHQEAIQEMCSADALLLTTDRGGPNASTVICGKIFEYLASQRPILTIGPSGWEGQRLIESFNAGMTTWWDPTQIVAALHQIYEARENDSAIGGKSAIDIRPISRITLSQNLAEILDSVNSPQSSTTPQHDYATWGGPCPPTRFNVLATWASSAPNANQRD